MIARDDPSRDDFNLRQIRGITDNDRAMIRGQIASIRAMSGPMPGPRTGGKSKRKRKSKSKRKSKRKSFMGWFK